MLNLFRRGIVSRSLSQLYSNSKPTEQILNLKTKRLDFGDKIFSQAILNVKSKKSRQKTGLISLEGLRLIQEALNAAIKPEMIFYSRKKDLTKLNNLDPSVELYKVPYEDMRPWSELTTCPGIIAICKIPNIIKSSDACIPVTVVCDQVREPGNLGAIIRCAAAAGIQRIILTKGCTDLWSSKVLRGAAGAHFHISVQSDVTWEEFFNYIRPDVNFLLAVNQPSSIRNIPCLAYHEIDYKQFKETVLVIGGETEGLSDSVIEKACQLNGKAVNIPISKCVESLNCVSAMSILLFEIKRQLNF